MSEEDSPSPGGGRSDRGPGAGPVATVASPGAVDVPLWSTPLRAWWWRAVRCLCMFAARRGGGRARRC